MKPCTHLGLAGRGREGGGRGNMGHTHCLYLPPSLGGREGRRRGEENGG